MTQIASLRAVRSTLQQLTIVSTKDNLEKLLACVQTLDDLIQNIEEGDNHAAGD